MDKFPKNMLFARAMSNGIKWFTPDVFAGPVYTPEELGSAVITEDTTAEVIDNGLSKAIADTYLCATFADLQAHWVANKQYQANEEFKAAKDARKAELQKPLEPVEEFIPNPAK